jgi:hypothetical protein
MNKHFAAVFFGFTALVLGWLLVQKREPRAPTPPAATADAGSEPGAGGGAAIEPALDGGVLAAGGAPAIEPGDGGSAEAAGGSPPGLTDAPKKVKIAVILVQYVGAEDARADARSKGAALSLAKEIAAAAAEDFAAAVKKGDPGSTVDAGTLGRNILDPDLEARVFTLAKGALSEPIDTPKGYWIVKRLE